MVHLLERQTVNGAALLPGPWGNFMYVHICVHYPRNWREKAPMVTDFNHFIFKSQKEKLWLIKNIKQEMRGTWGFVVLWFEIYSVLWNKIIWLLFGLVWLLNLIRKWPNQGGSFKPLDHPLLWFLRCGTKDNWYQ